MELDAGEREMSRGDFEVFALRIFRGGSVLG